MVLAFVFHAWDHRIQIMLQIYTETFRRSFKERIPKEYMHKNQHSLSLFRTVLYIPLQNMISTCKISCIVSHLCISTLCSKRPRCYQRRICWSKYRYRKRVFPIQPEAPLQSIAQCTFTSANFPRW